MSSTKSQTNTLSTPEKKFATIKKFIHEMSSFFQDDLALKLYNHLLRKTTMKNRAPVARHIQIFSDFCKQNRQEIIEHNIAFPEPRLEYSSRVYLDMGKIFTDVQDGEDSAETHNVLFDHLLVLSMVFDPESNAHEVLKNKAGDDAGDEIKELLDSNPFLHDIMDKVEKQVRPGANPMEAMSSMVSSGLLQELVADMQGKIESGELDMENLMGSVQRMSASLPSDQMEALAPMLKLAQTKK
jgi:hypothetical protein